MKKVLVTGSGGFIGAHLVNHLVRNGCSVRCLHRYTSGGSVGRLNKFDLSIEHFFGDIRDVDAIQEAAADCDYVFNLAALISIPYSYASPTGNFETNLLGVLNLLNLQKNGLFGRLIQMSTSETYGTAQCIPMSEDHPANAQSPYAASKVAADAACVSYFRSFGNDVVIARPFNVFGPGQSERAIIPRIVKQALDSPYIKLGNMAATRDFTYVSRLASGLYAAAMRGKSGEAYNLASGFEISVDELVKKIGGILGVEIEVTVDHKFVRPKNSEVERLFGDSSKAARDLGWVISGDPFVRFETELTRYLDWMRLSGEAKGEDGLLGHFS